MLTVCSGTVNIYIKDFVATKNSATKTNQESSFDS